MMYQGYSSTMKNCLNVFNHGRRSLKYEIRAGPSTTTVVSENIDAMRELIMQIIM